MREEDTQAQTRGEIDMGDEADYLIEQAMHPDADEFGRGVWLKFPKAKGKRKKKKPKLEPKDGE